MSLRREQLLVLGGEDGSIIYRGGDEPNLRLVDRIEPGDDELFTVLVVEPVE